VGVGALAQLLDSSDLSAISAPGGGLEHTAIEQVGVIGPREPPGRLQETGTVGIRPAARLLSSNRSWSMAFALGVDLLAMPSRPASSRRLRQEGLPEASPLGIRGVLRPVG